MHLLLEHLTKRSSFIKSTLYCNRHVDVYMSSSLPLRRLLLQAVTIPLSNKKERKKKQFFNIEISFMKLKAKEEKVKERRRANKNCC